MTRKYVAIHVIAIAATQVLLWSWVVSSLIDGGTYTR